ncbi:hypothetical protein VB776_09140 [Arcicella sp. DC2W]|uniref:DUF3796 domain-containing protein n=1 Tax=Arcicella gelida TaxID=2984195 RepID=A0ABU5S3J9_9BACT|nr:hypothetical protein [Arcicella sp. DC2W]MEA5403078.1 hypothetical protein [Arcicella sp. DC2W]
MKLKSVLLEILIVLLMAGTFYITAFFEGGLGKSTDFIIGAASGALLGFYFWYWGAKRDLKLKEHPNAEKYIQIWQYLMLFMAISSFAILVLYVKEIISDPKITCVMYLIWMMIVGNYRANIEVNQETISVYFDDEEINKKAKRFLGKIQVFGALITIILVLILPELFNYFSIIIYFISLLALPYFYARKLHKKKFA